ncbi:MAG: exosortase/archaeosortase family protein, partial [Planctomycetota bacterium]
MHSTEKPETDLSGPAETATSARWRTTRVGAQIALIAVACWAYWPTISGIVDSWVSNPDYSHGLLVGPIALLFMWARRDACPRLSPTHCWPGLLLLGAAALLRYVAARFYLPNLDGWSIPLWLGGIVWLFQGRQRFRWMLPSLAFLWFATPLPGTIEVLLSTPLQHIAAIVSGWSLRLIGQPAVVEGTTILLNEHVLDIERACSGLRMFYGILAMAFSCAVLLRMRGWMAFALLIATIPVAMIANVCRIVVTALLLQQYSSEAASRFSHDFAGVLMIPLAVVLFIAYASWLRTTVSRFHSEDRGRFASWITLWALAILV